MSKEAAIKTIDLWVKDAAHGLPEDVFLLVSRITPVVNVDLLIQDGQNRTLLTWRKDEHYGAGWHIPGGIIRFKETMAARVKAVARLELGAKVQCEPTPCAVNEIILPKRQIRGHFISLLFRCSLLTPLDESLRFKSGKPKPGEWKWHRTCPQDILPVHRIYARYIVAKKAKS